MSLFQRFIKYFMQRRYPQSLFIKGRKKLQAGSFLNHDKLYRSFELEHLDENDKVKLERIRFPDLSCNWSQFSIPEDILFRERAKQTDGCYSFTVETSRYKKIATPVHDPLDNEEFPNYAHVEVRALQQDEDINTEPPKGRKLKPKSERIEYRQNILKCMKIEFDATKVEI